MKTTHQATGAFIRVNVKSYFLLFIALFTLQQLVAQPAISSFEPTSGPVGSSVTITGANFNAAVANNIVYFGAAKAIVVAATTESITVTVPAGATYQPISVLNKSTKLTAYSGLPFILTFNGGNNGFLPNSFSDKTEVTDSLRSIGGRFDYDGDGKLDLAVNTLSYTNLHTLSILRNTSTQSAISFDETKIDTTGYGSVTADFDGDGKPDILGTNMYKNTSTTGNISFIKQQGISFESYLRQISVGDVDSDGRPDIALMYNNSIDIYKNVTTGGIISFKKKSRLYFSFDDLFELSLSDLNGDGKPDLSIANYGDDFNNVGGIYIYKNISTTDTISFEYVTEITGVGYASALAVGDLDGDSKPDIAVSDNYGWTLPLTLLKNTSAGEAISFEKILSLPLGSGGSISIADLDGDNKPDVILDNAIFKNISLGGIISLAPKTEYPFYISAVGDIDGDGKPDIIDISSIRRNQLNTPYIKSFSPVAAGSPGTKITITGYNFTGATAASFGGITAMSFQVESDSVITAIIGDGASGSVLVVTSAGNDSLAGFVYTQAPFIFSFNPTTGETGDTITLNGINFNGTTTVSFGGIAAAFFDVVNDSIIHAIPGAGATGSLSVSSSLGTDTMEGFTFTGFPVISSFLPLSGPIGTNVTISGKNFNPVSAGNIVYFGAVKANVSVATTTALTVTVPTGTTYEPISVLNKANGLTGYSSQNFIATFLGGGATFTDSSFADKVDFTAVADQIAVSDIDGDGKPDIVGIDYSGATLSVLRNTGDSGNISFAGKVDFLTGTAPQDVAIGDLDGNGKPDIVVTNSGSNTVSVFINTSTNVNISFTERIDYATGLAPTGVAIGDLDSDGKPDLVVAHSGINKIFIFRNISTGGTISFATSIEIPIIPGRGINEISSGNITIKDMDGDSKPEIIIDNSYSEQEEGDDEYYSAFCIFRNTGTSGTLAFAPQIDVYRSEDASNIFIGDLDGDSKPDLISVSEYDDGIFIFQNLSTNNNLFFSNEKFYNAGSYSNHAAIGDLSGDGKPDIAVANFDGISFLKNTSINQAISFTSLVQDTLEGYPDQVAICDFDNDGVPDIALGSVYNKTISILRNRIGEIVPSALFTVSQKISYIGNNIIFTDQSGKAASWQWDFDGDGIFDSEIQYPQYTYAEPGLYNVKLRINSNPLLEKIIPITILPNRGTPYMLTDGGNFETNTLDFAADNIGVSLFSIGNSTQPGKSGTHSGSYAWVIDIDSPAYHSNSTAYLYSPSYNCTAAGDYTLRFYAKYDIENEWDGFRVEYSIDKGNNWQILGNKVQANWYDYANLSFYEPRLFPQGEAYFSLNDAAVYTLKKFTTNIFQGNSSVAFRIVFKSDELVVDAGLAIDDFTLTGPTNVVLPVNLISFSGYNNSNRNILNWKTSTELNSSRYEIERSFDGNNFAKIGSVRSANSSIGSSYSYDDDISHIYTNNFYYRLKMVDKDGAYNYSPVVSVNIRNRNERIVLLGNVTSSYINVITPASLLQKPLQAVIININGAVVKTINISNTSSVIYVDRLAAGKYYTRFIQDGKTIQTEQFIKQ